jgi:hypothetical protein
LIEHIDAICRAKQRDVLYIQFYPVDYYDLRDESKQQYDWCTDKRRQELLDWLDANGIHWVKCGPFAEHGAVYWLGYLGDIYVDVPFNEADPKYCLLRDHIEKPDGSMRDENVRFYCVSLKYAMKYAHHDEEGFWDRALGLENSEDDRKKDGTVPMATKINGL